VAAGRLSSYRFRRRLLWSTIVLGFVASASVVGVIFWNTADATETFSTEPAQTYVAPRNVTLTKQDRAEIAAIARRFVETAVTREHPEEAYELVGPYLKGGLSREDWKSGDIPVVYFPADGARWKVEYATEEEVGLSVLLYPRAGETVRPTVFNMALAPHPAPRGWLITAWAPRGGTPSSFVSRTQTPEEAIGAVVGDGRRYSAQASAAWLLLPAGFLVLALSVPVLLAARERRAVARVRKRRAT
jgi:hypothetical protein